MNWFSAMPAAAHEMEHAPPRHLSSLSGPLPSPIHHAAGHGPAHDFRHHLADALVVGDLDAIHGHIARAEAHHVVPAHFSEMLNILWGPGPNTHEWRIGLASAINQALEMAKQYNGFLEHLNMMKEMPLSPELEEHYTQAASIIETFAKDLAKMAPSPRRTRCEATIERLRSAARREST